jgi:hypothetical protein
MNSIYLLAQAATQGGSDGSTLRIVAGVAAIACVVFIIIRRKKKASKDDWS